jgi:hypothetical protein
MDRSTRSVSLSGSAENLNEMVEESLFWLFGRSVRRGAGHDNDRDMGVT